MRVAGKGLVDRSTAIGFRFDGQSLAGHPGDDEKKMKQWTPRLDKLLGSSRDAVRSKPKKSKILRKIKDGKVVSTKVIRINPIKKPGEVKEQSVNPEFTTGMPLITPEPAAMPKAPAPKAKKKQSGSY